MLFLEGQTLSRTGKKKRGNLESSAAALPFSFHRAETPPSLGNSQAPPPKTCSLCFQRRLSHRQRGISLWLPALVCFQLGVETGPWRRFPGAAQKPVHIGLFSWLREGAWEWRRAPSNSNKKNTCTEVVFELMPREEADPKRTCAQAFRDGSRCAGEGGQDAKQLGRQCGP